MCIQPTKPNNIREVIIKKQCLTVRQADEKRTGVVFRAIFKLKDYMKIPYFCSHTKHHPHYTQKATKQPEEAN